jgi:hypothetical protein
LPQMICRTRESDAHVDQDFPGAVAVRERYRRPSCLGADKSAISKETIWRGSPYWARVT